MAVNEIKNISHAALVVRLAPDPAPPVVLSSWGIGSVGRFFSGVYIALLQEPIAGVSAGNAVELVSTEGTVLSSFVATPNTVEVLLATTAPMPAGAPVQLDALIIVVTDPAGAVIDADAVLNLEVRRSPTTD